MLFLWFRKKRNFFEGITLRAAVGALQPDDALWGNVVNAGHETAFRIEVRMVTFRAEQLAHILCVQRFGPALLQSAVVVLKALEYSFSNGISCSTK